MPDLPGEAPIWLVVFGLYIWLFAQYMQANKQGSKLDRIDSQVSNKHSTNLRDDITDLSKCVRDMEATLLRVDSRTQRMDTQLSVLRDDHNRLAKETYPAIAEGKRLILKYLPKEVS